MPNEFRLPNGLLLLEHTKVVQKSIYDHLHVTHEGQLRIIFTPELKIMSWEFCSRRHDEYITRRFLAPQVNHLLQIAQKYQAAANESGPAGVSTNDAQAICNMFASASQQLAKNLDHHSLNEHGLSKRYVRCLQISEVVNNMKDLIDFSHKNKLGPIESLKNYPRQNGPKLTMQNMHEAKGANTEISTHGNNEAPGVGTVSSSLQNAVAQNNYQSMLRSSSANQGLLQQEASQNAAALNNYQSMLRSSSANQGLLQQEASQNAAALNNYQNMLRSSSANQLQQEASQNAAALNNYQTMLRSSSANQSLLQHEASSMFKGPTGMHNGVQLEVSRSFRAGQLGQFQQHPMSFQQAMPQHQQNSFGAGASTQYQQHLIQQLLQEAKSSNSRVMAQQQQQPPSVSGPVITNNPASGDQAHQMNNGAVKGAAPTGTTGPSNLINSGVGIVQRCSSFKSVSSNPAAGVAASGGNPASPKPAESMHEEDELDHLISSELAESGLFMGEQQGGGAYSWNM